MYMLSEELIHIEEAFDLFDKNGDGNITRTELGVVMASLGYHHTDTDIEAMINAVDSDGSGTINFNEFVSLMGRKADEPISEQEVLDAFKVFDKDGNGLISAVELKYIMTSLGEKLTDNEVEEMIGEVDKDEDGHINYDEFVKMMSC